MPACLARTVGHKKTLLAMADNGDLDNGWVGAFTDLHINVNAEQKEATELGTV